MAGFVLSCQSSGIVLYPLGAPGQTTCLGTFAEEVEARAASMGAIKVLDDKLHVVGETKWRDGRWTYVEAGVDS